MNVLESLLGRKGTAEPVEPKLRPEVHELYLKLPLAKRRRLVRWAEQQATDSLAFDPSRDFTEERDAAITLELKGSLRALAKEVEHQFDALVASGGWKSFWDVVVGQDEPPDGLWGWAIIQKAGVLPASRTIRRSPVTFTSPADAREAGERVADALWAEAMHAEIAKMLKA